MKNKLRFITAILIFSLIASCGWFERKVEQKVNEKIDENLKKIDSTFSKSKMDSLMKQLDSIKISSDSTSNKNAKRLKKPN